MIIVLETNQYSGNMLELRWVCYHSPKGGRTASVAQTRIVDYQGRKVEGVVVDFEAVPESWTNYLLADGTLMKMKLSLVEVIRLTNDFNPQTGDPIYVFSAQNIVNIISDDRLKKKV